MATVREATLDLLREFGLTTIFGNPGSTELPFLKDFPDDFRYVLGLQEATALSMAEGYARGTGNAAIVNLHTGPGLGNAMGNLVTAWHNKTPLVVTAGQQDRRHIALEPLLTGNLVNMARPYVKRSHEPRRAEDVPGEMHRAYHTAMQNPKGPVFVSIPMNDWDAQAEPFSAREISHWSAIISAPRPWPTMLCLSMSFGVKALPCSCWTFMPSAKEMWPMCSTPEPMTTSWMPAAMRAAPKFTACCAEPHWRSTVVAAASIGRPSCSQALRATLNACSPNYWTHPAMTSSTSVASTPLRSSTSL